MVQANKNELGSSGQFILLGLIFCIGFFGYVMHTTDWFRAIPGDLVDARFNSVILEHLYQWVRGFTPKLWSPTFFYPFENVLAFSDNHFGSGWAYIIFRFAGFERESAFIAWFVLGNVMNFWVTYYVLRKLGFSIVAAGAGAFVFTFALPALVKEAHAQLTYRFAVPLACLTLIKGLQTKSSMSFAQSLFWLAVQFYCSVYNGVFLTYLLFTTLLAFAGYSVQSFMTGWSQGWRRQSARKKTESIGLFLFSLWAIFWLIYQYRTISSQYGFVREISETLAMIPRPNAYLLADQSALTGWIGQLIPKTLMRHEQQMFFGLGVYLIAAFGLWQLWIRRTGRVIVRITSIALLILMLMTLSIHGVSAYELFLRLPGVGSIRAVSRVALVMLFPLGLIVASAFDWVVAYQKIRSLRWPLLIWMIVVLTIESIYYRPYHTSVDSWTKQQAELRARLPPEIPLDAVLYISSSPKDPQPEIVEVGAMILAQDLGIPTLNGYSGNIPPGYLKPDACIDFGARIESYSELNPVLKYILDTLKSRVLLINQVPCSSPVVRPTNEEIGQQIASNIKLSVTGGVMNNVSGRVVDATVSIKNQTDRTFSTLSKRGPIRLSWRFVTLAPDGRALSQPAWATRKEMIFSLLPGMTHTEHLQLEPPTHSGTYRLEISLVQDGIVWFHDVGMQIAELPLVL